MVWEKSMQPRAACRSREHSYLVALRDGCCDNGDRLVVAHRSHALRNISLYGSVSGSRDVARCSRGGSCLVALRDGRSVTIMTRHSRALRSHTSGFYAEYTMGKRSGSRGVARSSWAQFARSRFATGAVTTTMRNSIAFRSYIF